MAMHRGSPLTDEELIKRHRREAEKGRSSPYLDELFARYHRRVAAWCLRTVGSRDDALDLAQEVFLKAFQKLDSFGGRSRFSTWLYAVTRNHCINAAQARRRRPGRAEDEEAAGLPDPQSDDLADRLNRRLDNKALLEFLNQSLDETEQKVMMMHYGQGYTLKAVTRHLSLQNESGAKAYIVSARRKIDKALARRQARHERQERERTS
ncbi:MAG TPA: RNA polymerase sigma factor [Acidobacteriota bacterium]|nr:RNA polymerase sigma factor [Acidobacteriota bacterium]